MLGQRIKELRKIYKMTQQDLADKLKLAKSTISQYENNINEPDNLTMQRIADIFEVSVDYLLGRTNEKKSTSNDETYNSLDEINKLIKEYGFDQFGFFDIEKWKNLSPEDVDEIRRHFEWVAQKAKERNEEKN